MNHTEASGQAPGPGFRVSLFKNILISGGYSYLAQGINFAATCVTARLLLPEVFGIVALITVFTGFISVFADSGISLAIIKSDYGLRFWKATDNISMALGISLCLITWLAAWPVVFFYDKPGLLLPMLCQGTLFVLKSPAIVRGAVLSKNLRFADYGKGVLISMMVNVVATIVMAALGASYWSLIVPQLIAAIVLIAYYESVVRLGFGLSKVKLLVFAFGKIRVTLGSVMGFNLINYWARNTDNLIVGKRYGVMDLGIYSRAYSVLTLPLNLITGLFGSVLYPSLKKLKAENEDINHQYIFVLHVISVISYPLTVALILFPRWLVTLFWGNRWLEVAEILPYFGLLIFSQSLLSTIGNILILQGKEKLLLASGWVAGIIIIAGIVYGALISVVDVARFYSLFFLCGVLPYYAWFVYYKALGMGRNILIAFWLPVIAISLLIWSGCYTDRLGIKLTGLMLLGGFVVLSSLKEIGSLKNRFRKNYPAPAK